MEQLALLNALLDLAEESGLTVRCVADGTDAPVSSATCRVRDAVWVVLAASDPLDTRIDVLASAIRTHAGAALEGRWLPPALRQRLEA